MSTRNFRVGTRASPLAIRQAAEVIRSLKRLDPRLEFEMVKIDTYGDRDKSTPISEIEGSDFFTREIDESLLKGEIDLALHSAKDLPDALPKGLIIAAITKSIDPYDALVSKGDLKLKELPSRARIGTSSRRRREQLKKFRSDFQLIDIRGTIEERLALLEDNAAHDLNAIVIAACALIRLGLEKRIAERMPFEILKPHPLQGSLAVEARNGNTELINFLKALDGK